MKLRFTRRAIENIGAIAEYIESRNPPAAQRVRAQSMKVCKISSYFPTPGGFSKPKAFANS